MNRSRAVAALNIPAGVCCLITIPLSVSLKAPFKQAIKNGNFPDLVCFTFMSESKLPDSVQLTFTDILSPEGQVTREDLSQ